MKLPKVDEKYRYTSDYYPMITDLKVKVKQSEENFIRLEVIDNEFIDKHVYNAKEHQKEFQDWENTLELFPFVERRNNKVVKSPELCLFSINKFNKQCTKV